MKKQIYVALSIVGCVLGLLWVGTMIYNSIQFDRHCEGYLKRAADANTVEMAKEQLSLAVNYCEANGLTSGYTSVIYTTPDEDVAFWYKNLKSSLAELNAVSPNATQLEKTNVLMKLRETLLDTDNKGETIVTYPSGIPQFPYNRGYVGWCAFSCIMILLFGFLAYFRWDD